MMIKGTYPAPRRPRPEPSTTRPISDAPLLALRATLAQRLAAIDATLAARAARAAGARS